MPLLYAHAVKETHSQSPAVTSTGGDVPSASCRTQAGAWRAFSFSLLGTESVTPWNDYGQQL